MILSRQLTSVCGRVVGFELRACVQTTTAVQQAARVAAGLRQGPSLPASSSQPVSPCLYSVIFSSSYYRISSVFMCVCAPPSIRNLLPSVAHQVLYPCMFPLDLLQELLAPRPGHGGIFHCVQLAGEAMPAGGRQHQAGQPSLKLVS